MRIALVNVSGRLSTDGSRLISALLKRAGHAVDGIFLSRREPMAYGRRELALLDPLLKQSDLVMLAVYSSYAMRAAQVTDYVHEHYPALRVIWGGPHCISVPEVGLRHADGVCFSEGDEAVVELCDRFERGADWMGTASFAFRTAHGIRRNPVRPPFRDLDRLPYYDFDLEGQYLLDRNLVPMQLEHLRRRLASFPVRVPTFYFMTSRGCPHNCAYCNNCRYQAMWGAVPIRLHSVERVIEELEFQLRRLPFIEFVAFGDDDFFVRPRGEIEEFARQYRSRIGLPFGVAASARTWCREKMDPLLDAGIKDLQMGVQSGSQRVLDEVFHRPLRIGRVLAVCRELGVCARSRGVRMWLDFIVDNPWETRMDVWLTLKAILELPPEAQLNVFFLTFFPGTPLYDRAVREGIIVEGSLETTRFASRKRLRHQRNWETFLVLLARMLRGTTRGRGSAAEAALRWLSARPVRAFMSVLPASLFAALAGTAQRLVFARARRMERASLRVA